MGRRSTKENKSEYQRRREKLGYSREKASELLETITPERLERIENGSAFPGPDDVLRMSDVYKAPELCNHYCSNECPIGQAYVPELKIKELSQIVLEILASLNSVRKQQERLIEIALDGKIEKDEIEDFMTIQDELKKISITVDTLLLWSRQMVADGKIDQDAYNTQKTK